MADKVTIERIPVQLNLGEPEPIVGWATATKNLETGQITLELLLDEFASLTLEQFVELFDLKALGFAGVKRRSAQDGSG